MLEIRFDRYGPPSLVAQCVNVPMPEPPSAWETLVKIEAFPINPADLAMLAGQYGILPPPQSRIGMEAVGKVVEVGSSVTTLSPGQRVMVVANENWSQYRTVPANLLHKIPDAFDPLAVANLKVNGATAFLLLTQQVSLKPGSWIIQNAPLSNVGRTVIRFAKAMGIRTINLVRRSSDVQAVIDLGGDQVVQVEGPVADRVREQLGRAKIALALDAVGGQSTEDLASCLGDKARIVTYGMLSGEPCRIRPEHLVFRGIEHSGFWLSKRLNRFSHQERVVLYDRLLELLDRIGTVHDFRFAYSMDQIGTALKQAEMGRGKVVVFPNGPPEDSAAALMLDLDLPAEPTFDGDRVVT